jgi:hypothetical protein
MPLTDLIFSWMMQQGSVQGTKSTVITPLVWAMGILTTGLMVGAKVGLSATVIGVFSACLVLVVLGLLSAFGYFAWKNPDALRTERYTLTKLAIEKRLSGDDMAGIREAIEMIGGESPEIKTALPTPDTKSGKSRTKKQEKTSESIDS